MVPTHSAAEAMRLKWNKLKTEECARIVRAQARNEIKEKAQAENKNEKIIGV